MKIDKLNDWLQLAASIGVLFGLFLVAYELRQDQALTRSDLGAGLVDGMAEITRSMQSNADLLAKAQLTPEDLTYEEHLKLDYLYWEGYTVLFAKDNYLVEKGLFESSADEFAGIFSQLFLSSAHGRAWWEENRQRIDETTRHAVDRVLAAGELTRYDQRITGIIDRLRRADGTN